MKHTWKTDKWINKQRKTNEDHERRGVDQITDDDTVEKNKQIKYS